MAFTATECFSEAQNVFLNNSTLYSETKLLPFLIKAYGDLKLELLIRNSPPIEKVSGALSVAALAVTVASPADMIMPLSMEERAVGATDADWVPMVEKPFEPTVQQIDRLIYWTWRLNAINFRGSTVAREVRIKYLASLPNPSSGASSFALEEFYKTFLAARMASLASAYIGEDFERASAAQEDANKSMGLAMGIVTKRRQGMPVRQRSWNWLARAKRRFL